VFSCSAIHDSVIVEGACKCGHHAKVDGAEHLVLRKGRYSSAALGAFELCFTWDVLDDAVSHVTSKGTHFWTLWKLLMQKYDLEGVPRHEVVGLHQVYRHYIAAIMDFVDLQHLPYSVVLRCKCAVPYLHLGADGILVACRRRAMHLQSTWLPPLPADGDEPAAALFGSEFAQRFAVPDARLRSELRALTTATAWSAEEIDAVRHTCDDLLNGGRPADEAAQPAATALLALTDAAFRACITRDAEGGGIHFVEPVRLFLRELSANSPACQIVAPCDVAAVQAWQTALRGALAAADEAAALQACAAYMEECRPALAQSAPLVEPCLTTVLQLALRKEHDTDVVCGAFLQAVGSLVQVCL
jgi:hypothetical protein